MGEPFRLSLVAGGTPGELEITASPHGFFAFIRDWVLPNGQRDNPALSVATAGEFWCELA
jgi:hypothetical protein